MALSPDLRETVAARVLDDPGVAAAPADRAVLRRAVARALAAEGVVVPPARWAALVRDLVDELAGLGPLEPLLRDPAVTDVMVNRPDEVWIERDGMLELTDVRFEDRHQLIRLLQRVLGPLGVRLDPAHPWADAVLPGGVRLHAVLPPLASEPLVTLRRVPAVVPTWEDLVAGGSVDEGGADLLRQLVRERRNLVICGRAGSGKTTLLARLLSEVVDDRVVVIQDAPELDHPAPHTVHLDVRPPGPDGRGGADVAMLLRNALRMRPDRIVIGEVRGAEVADLLQAMNTGHHGSATTVHANGPEDALVRLSGMALLAGVPASAAEAQLGTAVEAVVSLRRDGRRRRVDRIVVREGGERRQVWP